MPGRIRPVEFELGVNPLRWMPVEFDRALITGQIGLTEITLYACLVEFSGHNLNGFTPNSTGRIRPGINYWSIWVEIH